MANKTLNGAEGGVEFSIQRLNLLAFPRNLSPVCELTGERANVELITPYITLYYSSEELAEQAWFGIIKKIAHLLGPLMQPVPVIGTHDERARRATNMALSKRSLIEFCLTEASSLLSVQKYQLAIPAAHQALKFSKDVDGEMSVSMVEPYLQLSQASLGLKQFGKAEVYLSLARWIVHNSEECSDKTKSRLHMLKGRVSTAQGNFCEAKADFANAIYHSSRCYGAEAIITSIGYFRLGDVFLAEGSVECSLAYFDKVVDIWYKYLSELHQQTPANSENGMIIQNISEEYLSEGRSQLELIFEQRKRLLGSSHIATGEVQYSLGLFEFFLLFNEKVAEGFISSALRTYEMQLGPAHPSTKHVSGMLLLVQQTIGAKQDAALPFELNATSPY